MFEKIISKAGQRAIEATVEQRKKIVTFPKESDGSGEEVSYSQEPPKRDVFYRDFDWDLDCFVQYESPLIRKKTLSLANNCSHRNEYK